MILLKHSNERIRNWRKRHMYLPYATKNWSSNPKIVNAAILNLIWCSAYFSISEKSKSEPIYACKTTPLPFIIIYPVIYFSVNTKKETSAGISIAKAAFLVSFPLIGRKKVLKERNLRLMNPMKESKGKLEKEEMALSGKWHRFIAPIRRNSLSGWHQSDGPCHFPSDSFSKILTVPVSISMRLNYVERTGPFTLKTLASPLMGRMD